MYFETYRLSLGTRLSLRSRGTMVTLLAETHSLHLCCQVILGLYNAEELYVVIPKLQNSHINCLLTLLPLGPGAPTAP